MWKLVKGLFWIAVVLGAIGGVLYLTVLDVWRVPDDEVLSASLEPNLRAGDLVILSRRPDNDRGHLVRCADPRPENPGQFVVGRIMARASEEIAIDKEVVSVDGRRNPSPYGCAEVTMHDPQTGDDVELLCSSEETGETKFEAYRAKTQTQATFKKRVEGGSFVVSDNRHMHVDSRDFGSVDTTTCQHILIRLWGKDGISDSKHRFNWIW